MSRKQDLSDLDAGSKNEREEQKKAAAAANQFRAILLRAKLKEENARSIFWR